MRHGIEITGTLIHKVCYFSDNNEVCNNNNNNNNSSILISKVTGVIVLLVLLQIMICVNFRKTKEEKG